jgi:hypothetical protein
MKKLILCIAKEFSKTPGPRTQDEGDFSGEVFLNTILKPRFEDAIRQNAKLIVDLDGTEGYATSFLEASFGGLARIHPENLVLNTIEFITKDEPFLKEEIEGYIREARIK